jgi:hypothetical protein
MNSSRLCVWLGDTGALWLLKEGVDMAQIWTYV